MGFVAVGEALATQLRQRPEFADCLTKRDGVMWRLHKFLDVAAGEGFELGGVDAADLFIEIFEKGALAIGEEELSAAAKDFHNLTIGDERVRIKAFSDESRDAIVKAGERLRAAISKATGSAVHLGSSR